MKKLVFVLTQICVELHNIRKIMEFNASPFGYTNDTTCHSDNHD